MSRCTASKSTTRSATPTRPPRATPPTPPSGRSSTGSAGRPAPSPRNSPVRVFDWRIAEASDLDDAFAAEILRWQHALGWDASAAWAQVDAACRAGTLPGFVAMDAAERIAGWTFFVRHGQTLQIGALMAADAGVTGLLLDAVLTSSLAEDAASVIFFG